MRLPFLRSSALPGILLLGLIFGSSLVVSRFSVGQYDPRVYTSLRLLFAAVFHLGVYLVLGSRPWPRKRRLWMHASVLGLLGTAIPMTSILFALKYQSSGLTSLLLTLNPAVTVVLAEIFLHDENITPRKTIGVLVAFAGAAMLLLRGETGLADIVTASWRGYAWTALGIMASAGAGVYAKRYLNNEDGFDVASIRMFSAALMVNGLTIATVGYDLSRVNSYGYLALSYATLSTFFGFLLSFFIIQRFGATASSQTSYVIPVVSTIFGALLLGEMVSGMMVLGMLIIFAGLTLLNVKLGDALRGLYGIRRFPG